ncbi:putative reverse transcriptase domain-containing protein [Tanacetum coccineum]|uniref:Reverse transcriptase domain-containing protein n=1 Tax=Tanacetum coccineum TaxID=301880 RepID=A0ABQ5CMX1_9ASTR
MGVLHRPRAPMPFPSEAEVDRLLALPTPPPSPLISLSPPSAEESLARCLTAPALPSSPLPKIPHPYGSPNHVREPRGFRATMGKLRALSPSTHHPLHPLPPLPPLPSPLYLPPPIPTSLPLPSPPLPPLPASLFIPPPVNSREDIPEAELPPRKRLCLTALTSRFEVRESSTATDRSTIGHRAEYGFIGTLDAETRRQRAEVVGYGIRDVWVDPTEVVEEVAPTNLEGFNARVTEPAKVQEEDTQDLYALVEDAQDRQTRLSQRVDGQLSAALGQIQALEARDPTHADDPESADSSSVANNMPPKRTSAAAARVAAVAAAPMTAAVVEQLIEERVSEALAIHETLRNSINVHATEATILTLKLEGLYRLRVSKMESVFHISNCVVENQVNYTLRFKELALMCGRTFLEESNEVERYVGRLPDMIQGNVMSYQPKTMEKAIEFAIDQMDQKGYQQQNKRQNTRRAYIAGPGEKREYTESFPLCPNGNNNNRGNSRMTQNASTCYECGVQGHFMRDCPKLKNKNHGNQGGSRGSSEVGVGAAEEGKVVCLVFQAMRADNRNAAWPGPTNGKEGRWRAATIDFPQQIQDRILESQVRGSIPREQIDDLSYKSRLSIFEHEDTINTFFTHLYRKAIVVVTLECGIAKYSRGVLRLDIDHPLNDGTSSSSSDTKISHLPTSLVDKALTISRTYDVTDALDSPERPGPMDWQNLMSGQPATSTWNSLDEQRVACRDLEVAFEYPGYFVGYPKKTMGYHFYNPYENKVSVARHAELFENSLKCTRSEWESHFAKSE